MSSLKQTARILIGTATGFLCLYPVSWLVSTLGDEEYVGPIGVLVVVTGACVGARWGRGSIADEAEAEAKQKEAAAERRFERDVRRGRRCACGGESEKLREEVVADAEWTRQSRAHPDSVIGLPPRRLTLRCRQCGKEWTTVVR